MQSTKYFASHDGTQIWCGTVGEGPAMVLCDGFACDGFIWPYVIDHFCDHFQIVRWHYRGHGRSDTPEDFSRLSIEDLCKDLEAVLDALEIEEAILLGHSMGAQVILQSYESFPERIRALIPVCGTYARPLDTFKNTDLLARALPYLEKMANAAPNVFQGIWNTVVNTQLSYMLAHLTELNAALVNGEDFRPYLEHTAMMNVQVYVTMLHHLAEHSAEHILPTIEVPTLVVASEFDSFTPLDRSQAMHEMIAGSDMIILPGASHAGPIELPDTVIGAIEKFLIQHDLWPE
jgi:pimeloyl-ACP methyl ester carboxylesterase